MPSRCRCGRHPYTWRKVDPTDEEVRMNAGPDEILVVSECPCGERHYSTVDREDEE